MSTATVTTLTPRPRRAATPHRVGPPATGSVQGTLALDLGRLDPPQPRGRRGAAGCDLVAVDPRLRADVERWVERYIQAVLEIVAGDRPAAQVSRWTKPSVHQDLSRRALLVARAGGHEPGRRRAGLSRPQVHGVRLSFLTSGTVEAAVHVRHGDRSRAVAARFEVQRQRWMCTALELC